MTPYVKLSHNKMILHVRPGTTEERKQEILEEWYRESLKIAVPPIIEKWQKRLGVQVERIYIQRMKTKWGSCNAGAGSIRINTELAKKPAECLEYIVVHEMMHLLEPSHNARFASLMDKHVPRWQFLREELNRLPVRHEEWGY